MGGDCDKPAEWGWGRGRGPVSGKRLGRRRGALPEPGGWRRRAKGEGGPPSAEALAGEGAAALGQARLSLPPPPLWRVRGAPSWMSSYTRFQTLF